MKKKVVFVTTLNNWVKAFPLKSTSILSFILVVLEKLVDIEFECPCDGKLWNGFYFAGFLIGPASISCAVMLIIERDSEKKHGLCSISTFVPPLVWVIIVFLDGEYLDCAVTDRTGTYVKMEGDPTHRWCKPLNNTKDEIQLILRSKKNNAISQTFGIWIPVLCSFILAVLVCYVKCKKNSKTQDGDSETAENLALQRRAPGISVKVHNDEEITTSTRSQNL